MAIERGHNIISGDGRAVIGSVYFLIRPMPVPHQFSSAIRDMNHWAVSRWKRVEIESETILAAWNAYRKDANRVWEDILGEPGHSDTRQKPDVAISSGRSWSPYGRRLGARSGEAPVSECTSATQRLHLKVRT